ncbi:DUF4886 domain-containing protein, partial [Rubripirellula sp.]
MMQFLIMVAAVLFPSTSVFSETTDNTQGSTQQKHVKVLTVGNSFTNNATELLSEVVENSGHLITHKRLSIGGSSLQLHRNQAGDPSTTADAKYSNGETLHEALLSEHWDFVTLQQVSTQSHDVSTYQPYASDLLDFIYRFAPQAEIVIHKTWAYRCDDPRFQQTAKPRSGQPTSQRAMYEGLSDAYRSICRDLNTGMIPVGDAFWRADQDPEYGYKPDMTFEPSSAKYPNLPNQEHSLHVGYRWSQRGGNNKIILDGHHAGLAGKYLAACVWYACLFDEDPCNLDYAPKGISVDYATFLRQTAREVTAKGGQVLVGKTTIAEMRHDVTPKRYRLQARASEIDPRTREYPAIGFN